jgi:hypothetical protein
MSENIIENRDEENRSRAVFVVFSRPVIDNYHGDIPHDRESFFVAIKRSNVTDRVQGWCKNTSSKSFWGRFR